MARKKTTETNNTTLNPLFVKCFAVSVIKGTYTLDESETPTKKLVPAKYHDAVAQWIADYVSEHETTED